MRKILLSVLIGISFNSHAEDMSGVSLLSTASVMVFGSAMLSNSLSTLSKTEAPTEYRNIKIDKVTHQENDKVLINATVTVDNIKESLDFEIPKEWHKILKFSPDKTSL